MESENAQCVLAQHGCCGDAGFPDGAAVGPWDPGLGARNCEAGPWDLDTHIRMRTRRQMRMSPLFLIGKA